MQEIDSATELLAQFSSDTNHGPQMHSQPEHRAVRATQKIVSRRRRILICGRVAAAPATAACKVWGDISNSESRSVTITQIVKSDIQPWSWVGSNITK